MKGQTGYEMTAGEVTGREEAHQRRRGLAETRDESERKMKGQGVRSAAGNGNRQIEREGGRKRETKMKKLGIIKRLREETRLLEEEGEDEWL